MPITAPHSSLQHSQGGRLARRACHRLLLRDRPRHSGAAGRRGLDGVRERPPAGGGRGSRRLPATPARRHRRRVDASRGGADRAGGGRRRRAREQRRLQPERRRRGGGARRGPASVRDERLRADAPDTARPARNARAALGADRQRQLDGRRADLPGRRLVPRLQARGGGAQRRAPLRGRRLRDRRGRDPAGTDPHRLRGGGRRVNRGRRGPVWPVRRGRRRGDRGCLRRRVRTPARRRAGHGRGGDRAGGEREAPANALPRHPVRATVHRAPPVLGDRGWDALVGRSYPRP